MSGLRFEKGGRNFERIPVPDKYKELSAQLLILEKSSMPVDNPAPVPTGREESEGGRRTGGEPGGNSRILMLASIAQYRAKRRTATAEKRLANKLLVENECSQFRL